MMRWHPTIHGFLARQLLGARTSLLAAMVLLSFIPTALANDVTAPKATVRSPHGALGQRCEDCHTFSGWSPIRSLPEFNHDKTRFPLRGVHAGLTCTQCHVNLLFSNVGTKCADCHADIHRRQMGAACERCHTVRGWRVEVKQIELHQNRFPLIGGHAAVDCESCHKQAAAGRFVGLTTNCASCHLKEYETASFDHRTLGVPPTCEVCHSMSSWFGAKFDHARFFPLTGVHATLDCRACHQNGTFKGAQANCSGCHAKDFMGTKDPSHVQAGFPHDCGLCHSTASWLNARFDHAAYANFPLTGVHATLPCVQCHVNGRYAGTPADCASCHIKDYNSTTDPNHRAAGFPTDCSACHNTSSWNEGAVNRSTIRFGRH